MKTLVLHFDGGNAQNLAVWGVVGIEAGKEVCRLSGICDQSLPQTNNVAEWTALYYAMVYAFSVRDEYDETNIYGDSELIVKQINGEYSCRNPHLIPFYAKTIRTMMGISNKCRVFWIPREQNEVVDGVGRETRKRYLGA